MSSGTLPSLVIDTHVWYWMLSGDRLEKKDPSIRSNIERYLENDLVRISAISLWEIAMLESRKRIELNVDCLAWLYRAVHVPGIEVEEITPQIAYAATRLRESGICDPADQIILATAMSLGAVLATRDQKMIAYAEENRIPLLKV